ncbi:type II toxin-antitoxin system RelE/ParE family toxin [Kineococcus sp. TBRC 1896]|uniref:Type II toxin-antitoxin system RelE/ParE family toxin n=1 Tax=Kineococcus mangrovi TaxID=1660183 RepID=A0ABV4I4V1_9ACTN
MSAYDVDYAPAADRDLKRIRKSNPQAAEQIETTVKKLAINPRPAKSTNIVGSAGEYRLEVKGKWGSFRVRYEVHDGKLLVLVLAVADRKDIYKRK